MGISGNIFVGHSSGERKKFNLFFPLTTILLFLFLFWVVSFNFKSEIKKEAKPHPKPKAPIVVEVVTVESGVEILESATCREIKNNLPDQISDTFSAGEKTYYYTRLNLAQIPSVVQHIWINPEGGEHAVIELDIAHRPADTWSRIALPPDSVGVWKVKIAIGGVVVDERTFRVE